jgi:hypothetical protein
MSLFGKKKQDRGQKGAKIPITRVEGIGHGSHWDTFHPNVESTLDYIMKRVTLENMTKFATPPFGDLGQTSVSGHKTDFHAKLSTLAIVAEVRGKKSLATAYPILWSVNSVPLKLDRIQEWPIQIEAYLTGQVGDAHLSFFPVDFFFKRDYYMQNEISEISLGFFGYEQETNPFKGKSVQGQGRTHSMDNAEIIFPLWKSGEGSCDDYRITGKVLNVQKFKIFDEPAYITTISCVPIKKLDVFCLQRNMDLPPRVGEMIGVAGWLQGRYTHEKWKVMG